MNLKIALGLCLALATALIGCRSPVAGGRPVDGGGDVPPEAVPDRVVSEPYCPADAAGGGVCPINFCGEVKSVAVIPSNQFGQSGADSICNAGRVCVVGPVLGTGDGFELVCADPTAGARAFGAACSPNPADGMRCAADALCIEAADFQGSRFCSRMCRNDADCPTDASGPARCVEHQTTDPLPNGSYAKVGMCTPASKIAGTPCIRERDCMSSQGCIAYGGRTSLRICRAATGTKAVGEACAGNAECRSGECYDRDFHLYGGQRAYCSSACTVNSDCGADQRCVRLVVGNNGTINDPLDDLVSGYCETLFPPVAASDCQTSADCVARADGSDTCDVAHGLCFKQAAMPGDRCASEAECPLGGACSTGPRFAGGYCQTFGCAPTATSGVDACPGAGSACVQRGGPDEPIAGCYEGCAAGPNTCSRAADGYDCEPPKAGELPSICLVKSGT